MPALIGEKRRPGEFGDLLWHEYDLSMRFCHFNKKLRVQVNFNVYKSILLFQNEQEIDNYVNVLKKYINENR